MTIEKQNIKNYNKIWQISDKVEIVDKNFVKKYSNYDIIILQLLYNRGIINKQAIDAFFCDDLTELNYNPFLFNDMDEAIKLIIKHIKSQNKIVIYGDYDADGIFNLNFRSPHLGEHNLKTVIYYADGTIATIENRVIVDPEGYIYETLSDGQEKRISNALITLYAFNNLSNEYEAWPAINFNQVNPQVTQKQGTYQFLVPAGKYYIDINNVPSKIYIPYKVEDMELVSAWLTKIKRKQVIILFFSQRALSMVK